MILIDANLLLYESLEELHQHHRALELIEGWLEHPVVVPLEPGPGHWSLLRVLLAQAGTAANLSSAALTSP